jgi:phosphonate transport system permease protein
MRANTNNISLPVKPFNKSSFVIRMTLLTLSALTMFGLLTFDYKDLVLSEAIRKTGDTLGTMLLEPHAKHFTFGEALGQVVITIGLAFLTTLFGAVIALFLALLTARNLSRPGISLAIRSVVAFIRAVPTVLWVLIFAVAAGLGSVAAVIGMTFHSISYLVKAYSESIEEMEDGVVEALRASGAGWWQIVFQAVLPSSISYIISWTFVRFEINFAVAVAMGAAAGAGGIGFDMFMASNFYFDIREIGFITYMILAFAILLELLARWIKRKLAVNA